MGANWRKLRQLSGAERWLLIQAIFLLPLTALSLRWLGFSRWRSTMAHQAPIPNPPVERQLDRFDQWIGLTLRMVEAAARHGPFRANCLHRSLTLWWLLHRQGIESQVRLGGRKAAGRFEAHAWVEVQGVPLAWKDEVQQRFMPFGGPHRPPGGVVP